MRVVPLIVFALVAAPAAAADSGGTPAPEPTVSPSAVGGASLPPSGAPARASLSARVARGRPAIRVRFSGSKTIKRVTARVDVVRKGRVVARVVLGAVRLGRPISVPWRRGRLAPGRYTVLVHAHDRWNRQLGRPRHASGRAVLVVKAPKRKPTPSAPPLTTSGPTAFPVAGPFSYGDGIGKPRKGHTHQGQDILGARGTPIVAPTAGTVVATDYQGSAAGEYVVVSATNGYSYFFAHCIRRSTAVTVGQAVQAGSRVCLLGSTGGSSGPHLHFEIWVNGWRTSGASHFIDPLPMLKSWQ
jgi:murein DD-endopeptidase MepM/ murein hydrolase activator NlpD